MWKMQLNTMAYFYLTIVCVLESFPYDMGSGSIFSELSNDVQSVDWFMEKSHI